jgi:hypothetical protein
VPVTGSGVELRTEPQPPGCPLPSMGGRCRRPEPAAERDEVGQCGRVDADGGGGVEVGRAAVEADEGVEVDDAAPLVFGDLGELQPTS